MKKLIALLLAAAVCLSLTACKVDSTAPYSADSAVSGAPEAQPEDAAQDLAESEQDLAVKAEKYNDALALLSLTGELWDANSFETAVTLFDKYEGFDLTYEELQALFEDAPEWEEGMDSAAWEEAYAAWEEEHPLALSANDRYYLALEVFWYTRLEEAYQLLEEVGNYEDAAEHLSRFTVLEDQLLLNIYAFEGNYSSTSVVNIRSYLPNGQLASVFNQQEFIVGLKPWETNTISSLRTEYTCSDRGFPETATAYNTAYDENWNPVGDYVSQVLTYTYDAAGRLISTNSVNYSPDSSIREDLTYTLSYNSDGQLIKAAYVGRGIDNGLSYDIKSEYALTYDEEGRLKRQSEQHGRTFDYNYDEDGTLREIIETSSFSNSPVMYSYRHDSLGRPANLSYSRDFTFYMMDGTDETTHESNDITYVYGNYYIYR